MKKFVLLPLLLLMLRLVSFNQADCSSSIIICGNTKPFDPSGIATIFANGSNPPNTMGLVARSPVTRSARSAPKFTALLAGAYPARIIVTHPQNFPSGGPIPPGSGGGSNTFAFYDAANTPCLPALSRPIFSEPWCLLWVLHPIRFG